MSISDARQYDAFKPFEHLAALVAEEDRPAPTEVGRIIGYVGRAPSRRPTLTTALRAFLKVPLKPHGHAA